MSSDKVSQSDAKTNVKKHPSDQFEAPLLDQSPPLPIVAQRAKIDPRLLSPQGILQLQRTLGNKKVSQMLSSTNQKNSVQLYREEQDDPVKTADVTAMWGVRGEYGYDNRGALTHNVAYEIKDTDNSAVSKSNSHAEPQVMSQYLLNRTKAAENDDEVDNDLQIQSERKPCSECKADLEKYEDQIDDLEITVYYFVPYSEEDNAAAKVALTELYEKKGKITRYKTDRMVYS